VDKLGLSVWVYGPVEGCDEYGNDHLSSIKGNFLTTLASARWLSKKLLISSENNIYEGSDMFRSLWTLKYEGWNFNSGNYLFTADTK